MCANVVIYYNDSIDSDNSAAALALMRATVGKADTRVIWILEPRQVSLGLTMTGEQRVQCLKLIERHFPTRGRPFKVLLGGLLNEADLDGIDGLNAQDRELLQLAVKPENGPKEDAILHGRLTAWDQVTCMAGWANAPVEVLMDLESLDRIQNPVNLNFHHKEELVSRSEDELKARQDIMNEPLTQRVESLRKCPGFGGSTLGYAQLDDYDGTFIFRPAASGIPMYDIAEAISLKEGEISDILASIAK
ncbi:hypothetical protein G7Z17_g8766 [Cylindrodendrum hubeiense]|uniref:Uncharacterized protein n=1 Tax=Cylindrodendrum hubeiense TaxID=595255 RepID=A0A9P5L684_9HYPO|nr:hypothetical protein G7Z17_g8766 [Cylindrodendrum hubeiense]